MTIALRRPPRPLAGAAVIAAATLLVLATGLLVARLPFAFDRAVLSAVRGAGPAWLRRAAIDLTALGGGTVLTLAVLAAATLLLVRRQPLVAAALVLACWSGGRVVQLVKDLVARARPDLADRLVPVTSASFPSAHAANSAIVYLTLAALAAQLTTDRATRRTLFTLAVLTTGAIGASRVYLGVHWPSDVVAGWSFGTLWALGWWWLTARARASLRSPRQ
ncbi:phosphatase PAP2 family protein [Sphingomonas rubra]|uniref:Undecaprenyl-diphosphatase n=1 Tax=Sphingomonas rubra TaxID=634430 RepID=A0A1I5SGQ4_9SPHN|nr:phosphatase PAP2 family protein [Sphingomonas rubra]SFP69899.1 undecaprenyl-diphosphatase [Sphingomonas rubra]